MFEYMHTVLNGLKAWVTGEVNKLLSKIDAVGVVASRASNAATKNKNAIASLNKKLNSVANGVNDAHRTADAAQNTADTAQSTADTAWTKAATALNKAVNAQRTADFAVKYESQNLTDSQKSTARSNIGAVNDYDLLENRPCYMVYKTNYNSFYATFNEYGEFYTGAGSKRDLNLGEKTYFTQDFDRAYPSVNMYLFAQAGGTTSLGMWNCVGNLTLIEKLGKENLKDLLSLSDVPDYISFDSAVIDNKADFCIISQKAMVSGDLDPYRVISTIERGTSNPIKLFEVTSRKPLSYSLLPDTVLRQGDDILIRSSTIGSTKQFEITVDDSGTISATEVTT